MSAHTTTPMPTRLRRRWLFAAAAATIATAAASTLLAIGVGRHDTGQHTAAPSNQEHRYAKAISALTPEQLAAAYGTDTLWTTGLTPKERRYLQEMASLTPAQLAAAFGAKGAATLALSPKERRYIKAITTLTPPELAAAFGTGRWPSPTPLVRGRPPGRTQGV
jgi:hypothetical protein